MIEGAIPAGKDVIPPQGWILVHIQSESGGGGEFWIDPRKVNMDQFRAPTGTLSDEQVQRITRFKQALGAHDAPSLSDTLDNFRRDSDPDIEIAVWEKITGVFLAELAARPEAGAAEEGLVYLASLLCSLVGPDPGQLLANNPNFKALPNLGAVTRRYREWPAG